jgi:S-DNA-T family DNA segregation ATPase FtsK/SpoIIIE
LIKRGRKYGIILILATHSPTKDSIPREITRNISCGVAFAVADHVANDGLLGAGKYKAGIRATDLRMKADRGTSVAVGVTSNIFELLRWFYIPFEDDHDDVTPIIARALALIAEHGGRTIPTPTEPPAVPVDHLADIHAALGGQRRVRTHVVLTRLAQANPDGYQAWTFTDLRAALAPYGVAPIKSAGVMVVRAEDITTALTHRTTNMPGVDPEWATESDTEPDTDPGS